MSTMNYERACKTLDIDPSRKLDMNTLKKQFRLKALLYHPDKNPQKDKDVINMKFCDVKESYEFLLRNMENPLNTLFSDEMCGDEETSYNDYLFSFLKSIMTHDKEDNLFYTILQRISGSCEAKVLDTLIKLDKKILLKIYTLITKYKESFHFSDELLESIKAIITNKTKDDERIILNPTIDDLFDNNLYRLEVNDNLYVIPLWHNELVYDNDGNDMYVKCYPMLPENVEIDHNNNLHIHKSFKIGDIWGSHEIEIEIGKKNFSIKMSDLKMVEEQVITKTQCGISRINTKDIYDISSKGNIVFHVRVV